MYKISIFSQYRCIDNKIDWKYELWDKINETDYKEKNNLLKMHEKFWK